MDNTGLEHLQDLRNAHTKRLRLLELKEAQMGQNTPASMLAEIEELRHTIHEMDEKIKSVSNTALSDDQIKELREILLLKTRRLQYLELQQAMMGNETSPSVLIEIEALSEEIDSIKNQLANSEFPSFITSVSSQTQQIEIVFRGEFNSLQPELTNAVIRALAAMVDVSPENITISKVTPG